MHVAFTAGLLVQTILKMAGQYKTRDLFYVGLGLLAGAYLTIRLYEDYETGDALHPGLGLIAGYMFIVAFRFRDRILSPVTEGALFLYGLVGVYLYINHIFTTTRLGQFYDLLIIIFLAWYLVLMTWFVFSRSRPSKLEQTILMVMYLVLSVGIGLWLVLSSQPVTTGPFQHLLLGIASFTLIANLYYLLYFIPYHTKHQSMQERMQNIKYHARQLELNYIDSDTSPKKLLLMIILIGSFLGLASINFMNITTLVALYVTIIAYVVTPAEKTIFMPDAVYEKL